MEKISCSIVKDLLPLYVEDVVSAETAQEIQLHLDTCEDCCHEFKKLETELVLPSNPAIQEESGKVLKAFRHKWKMKKIATACISVILTTLIIVCGYMVYEEVGIVHDFFSPCMIVNLRDMPANDEWQRIRIGDSDVLVFDSIFYSKEATLDANSARAVSIRILDRNSMPVLEESTLQPGSSLDLDMLKRKTEYIVEIKTDGKDLFLNFH